MFPDQSLTPENLSSVLDIMADWLWDDFSRYVNIPASEIDKIDRQYSSLRERKQAVIPHIISTHPSLSWRLVAHALYRMVILYVYVPGVGDDTSHRALDRLQQKFPTGNTYCIQHYVCPHSPRVIPPWDRGCTYHHHFLAPHVRGGGGASLVLGPDAGI